MRKAEPGSGDSMSLGVRVLIVTAVVLSAAVVFLLREGGSAEKQNAGSASVTSARNDALADYEEALETDLPVYVLFHSLTCDPCIEISKVADGVLPEYRGKIAFVNAITDHSSGQALASRFSFQYIPTSFFLAPDGEVVDSHVGPLSAEDMRAKLDALTESSEQ